MLARRAAWLVIVALQAAPALGQSAPDAELLGRQVSVARGGPIFTAPAADAPSAGHLRAGGTVQLLAVIVQRGWFQVRLPDNATIGYLPAERLLPYDLDKGEPLAQPAEVVTGPPQVLDTATLRVGGRIVALDGIEGAGAAHARALQGFIDSNGGTVACHPARDGRFTCTLPGGTDVAMAALVNGSALAATGAEERFQRQQAAAAAARRGLWSRTVGPGPLPADNRPTLPRQDRLEQTAIGGWTAFRAAIGTDGSRACGIETAWREASASLTLLFVGLNGQRLITLALRDAGWVVPAGLGGPGTIVVDGASLPVQWIGLAPNDPTVLAGTPSGPGGLESLLTAMQNGHNMFALTPMGRSGGLTLVGAKAAAAAFMSCIGWAAGAASPPGRH